MELALKELSEKVGDRMNWEVPRIELRDGSTAVNIYEIVRKVCDVLADEGFLKVEEDK